MPTVSTRVLRDQLSSYLQRAEAGEQFVVLRDGRPVAALVPLSQLQERDEQVRLVEMAARGLVTLPKQTSRSRLADDWEELMQVPVGAEILALIPGLCERHPLRSADAVHLASVLLLRQEGLEIRFACSDGSLLEAAATEGLAIFDPVREP
jgi:antitoxin (DNA-binding transcriptional repressor) of toxin-antitoxin stability system